MKLKYNVEFMLLRGAVFCVNLLPLPVINLLTAALSWVVWLFFPYRLPVAYDNVSTIFPDMSHVEKLRLIRRAYRHFLHAAGLILVLHRKAIVQAVEEAEIGGLDVLDQALSEGKGVILTTYHGCWFEMYFAWFSRGPRPTSLIYQQQSNPLCDAFFVSQRRRYGRNLTHINSLQKLNVYQQALEDNQLLIISLDQNYTDNGTPVALFDREFTCARGAALLHLKTGAPVLTSVYYYSDDTFHIDFERVALPRYQEVTDRNIHEVSNLSIKMYQKTIRDYPDQWFSLFHRLWKKTGYPKKIKRSLRELFM